MQLVKPFQIFTQSLLKTSPKTPFVIICFKDRETRWGRFFMESMNKFKALTVLIICVFVFAIAAMYVNTKDATEQRAQERSEYEEENYDDYNANARKNQADVSDLKYTISHLEKRISELETKTKKSTVSSQKTSTTTADGSVRCKIYGTRTGAGIEQISPEVALQDVRINGNDLVLTCSLR